MSSLIVRRELRKLLKIAPPQSIQLNQDPIEIFCNSIKLKNVDISIVALQSLKLFIESNLVNSKTLHLITETVTKIEFTSSETELVEEAWEHVLRVCRSMIECQSSFLLTNASVSEIIILCFRFLNSKLAKHLLQRAERTLLSLTRRLFQKLYSFPDDPHLKPSYQIRVRLDGTSSTFKELAEQQQKQQQQDSLGNKNSGDAISTLRIITEKHSPCNLALINDFFCFLSSLINPDPLETSDNQKAVEAKIILGLRLLCAAFNDNALNISQKSCLLHITRKSISYSIVTILRIAKSPQIISLALNLASEIFTSIRHYLKYQFEEFLECLMHLMTANHETLKLSPKIVEDIRADALETVLELFGSIPHLAHELYYNFDCDPNSSDVFENFIQICSKNCFHQSPLVSAFTPIQLTSFKSLLHNLDNIYVAESSTEYKLVPSFTYDEASLQSFPTTCEQINNEKRRKRLLWLSIEKFNVKAKDGVKHLKDNKLISTDKDLVSLIKNNININKKQLGEYLSKEENNSFREHFIKSLNFTNVRIDDALREMLKTFRLPGESQLIERILKTFSCHWFEQNPDILKTSDEALSLAYAIIILNVDQHSKKVKPMTCDEFDKNLLGPKSERVYDRKLVEQIFSSIGDKEIVLPDEQQGESRRRYLWDCLLAKSEQLSALYWITSGPPQSNTIVAAIDETAKLPDATVLVIASYEIPLRNINKILFDVIWSPTVAAITFIFDKVDISIYSELPKQIMNDGFLKCANLCAKHGHLDNLVGNLCKFATNLGPFHQNQPMTDKNSLAASCLLHIVEEHANCLSESWSMVVRNILQWYCSKLLDNLIEVDDFALQRRFRLSMREMKKQHNTMNESNSTFLQSVYSYFAGQQQQQQQQLQQQQQQQQNSQQQQQPLQQQQQQQQNTSALSSVSVSPTNGCSHNFRVVDVIRNTEYHSMDSLNELISALTTASIDCDAEEVEDAEVLKLELFTQVVLTNHKLIPSVWAKVVSYFLRLCSICGPSVWLGERIISSFFRIAIVFINKPVFCKKIFHLLSIILTRLESDLIRTDYTLEALQTFTITENLSPLSSLDAAQLKDCFEKLIFPVLDKISDQTESQDKQKLIRHLNRAANLLSKVFLKHLHLLSTIDTFAIFWSNNVLETMDRFVKASGNDEQFKVVIFEVVKNMVLVMHKNECLKVEMKDAMLTKFIFWGFQGELEF